MNSSTFGKGQSLFGNSNASTPNLFGGANAPAPQMNTLAPKLDTSNLFAKPNKKKVEAEEDDLFAPSNR